MADPRPIARPLRQYHEDMGPVTWWKFPIEEPSWIGTPNCSDWPGYHTHFTPHPPIPKLESKAERRRAKKARSAP